MMFPIVGAAFIASSHAKCGSSKYHYPRSTILSTACTSPRMRSTCGSRSPSPAPRLSTPRPPQHRPRHIAGPRRAFSVAQIAFNRLPACRAHPLRSRRPLV
ncbi:hypothetical protein B0H19DRAFT_647207 [Mycena capillaripes]|nr:hypothetical protein B0H19DRAFT_647207 [Mycena capillaripes]